MSLSREMTTTLANALVAARRGGALVPAGGPVPASDTEAYRVQDAIVAQMGMPVRGWKVGAGSPTATPNGAPIFDVHPASRAALGALPQTGVELELAFVLGQAFPASASAPSRNDVEAAISSAHIVLETCASRLADGMRAPERLRLADCGTNLGLVIGPSVGDWRHLELPTLSAQVQANGQTIADLQAAHTAPDLVGLLTWLVGHVVTERGGMAAGTIVTTGSWSGIRWVTPPAAVVGTFKGVGTIEVAIN